MSHSIKNMSSSALSAFLMSKGVSAGGSQSTRDNGITGDMFVEFCEEDIRDAFSLFKDRFIIRKLIREYKSSSKQSSEHVTTVVSENKSTLSQCKNISPVIDFTNESVNTAYPSSHPVPHSLHQRFTSPHLKNVTHTGDTQKTGMFSEQPRIRYEPTSRAEITPDPTRVKVEAPNLRSDLHVVQMTANKSVSQPTVKQERQTNMQSPLMHQTVSSTDEIQKECVQKQGNQCRPLPLSLTCYQPMSHPNDPAHCSSPPSNNTMWNLVTVDDKERVKRYTAEELLAKKSIRGKPSEAQHLGSLAIRNAAQSAELWDNPPIIKDISAEKREVFQRSLLAFAPQLGERMDIVWIRLREAMQNRRKYLSDKETGKRMVKNTRYSPYDPQSKQVCTNEAGSLMKITDAGSLIDLTNDTPPK